MAEQCPDRAAVMWARSFTILSRLERARLRKSCNPSLTVPEWELLAAFCLSTVDAVRQRLDERAMLAAYDGAPGTLTELLTERLPVPSERVAEPNCERGQAQAVFEDVLEYRIDYDPETLRATIRYTATRRLREPDGVADRQEFPKSRFYAVTFDVRDGSVILRECGTAHQIPGRTAAQHDVVRELVPQAVR